MTASMAALVPPEGRDGWLLLGDTEMKLGEIRRLGFVFLSGFQTASRFYEEGKFFLWEGHIVGEATKIVLNV